MSQKLLKILEKLPVYCNFCNLIGFKRQIFFKFLKIQRDSVTIILAHNPDVYLKTRVYVAPYKGRNRVRVFSYVRENTNGIRICGYTSKRMLIVGGVAC